MDSPPDERLKIVFDEALRALTQQQARLDNVRSRATTLTAAAALISSFVGSPILKARDFSWASVLALVAVLAVLACSLIICAPWWRWHFYVRASKLLEAVDAGYDLNGLRRNLADDFDRWVDRNDRKLTLMHWLFTAGLLFLVVELVALSIPLWSQWGAK
ncbi:hypothetical protein ACRYCC_43490 [Actinomadura scrupuli]|uniref:hypothetical protein n=1 Tax=Actinomadura scrupuli TaxID=559629 RepID=UPI003D98D461